MPRYDMRCTGCGWEGEVTCKIAECREQRCDQDVPWDLASEPTGMLVCDSELEILIAGEQTKRTDMKWKMFADMSDGTKVEGSFGQTERKNKLGFL